MHFTAKLLIAVGLLAQVTVTNASECGKDGSALQVLGSGGPVGIGRASSGYLVWVQGKSAVMIDAGGGTFARFHESRAKIRDLKVLALSHLHPDHSSELPALLWLQPSNLLFAGPPGSELYPPMDEFLARLFSPKIGAFRIIPPHLDPRIKVVDANAERVTLVYEDESIVIRGIGVPHGDVPTIGYRVDIGDKSIGFSSDQIGTNPAFTELVAGVDILVVHFAASETPEALEYLHAKPSVWGTIADETKPKLLVLSHLIEADPSYPRYMMVSGSDLAGNIEQLRKNYSGKLVVAEDLLCLDL